MANKFLKRTLSVVMCAAMLVSAFAGSFTVSADETATNPTTTNEDGTTTTTYQWDYTGTDDSDSTVAETLKTFDITDTTVTHGTGYQFSDGSKATNDKGEKTGFLQMTTSSALIPFTTPENTDPSSFTLVAPNNSGASNNASISTGAPIIGSAKKSGVTVTYSVFVATTVTNGYPYCQLVLQGSDGKKTTQPITLKNDYCTSGSSCYFDLKSGVTGGWSGYINSYFRKNLTYTYTIAPGEDNSVTINIKIQFNRPTATIETEKLYTFTADPITISLDTINEMYNDSTTTVSDFTPSFGIASGWYYNSLSLAAKVYSVNAVYKKGDDTVEPEITASANVVLDEGIKLKITAEGNEGIQADTLKLTVDGEEKELTNGAAIITKYAHQMTDKMVIKLTATGNDGTTVEKYIGDESGYSIADNLESIYNLETTSNNDKTLIAKLANYGAAAQEYYNLSHSGHYTEFANAFLDDTDENKKTSDEAYKTLTNTPSGGFKRSGTNHFSNSFSVSLALSLQDNVKMVAKISGITLGDNEKLYIKMDDEETELEDNGSGEYTAVFGEFPPKDYDKDKTITLVVKSDGSEVEVSNAATYSVGAYINRMAQKNVTTELKTLLNALAEYYSAATAATS